MKTINIEICIGNKDKYKLRIGDIKGSTELSNFTKEEVLKEISDEIDKLEK